MCAESHSFRCLRPSLLDHCLNQAVFPGTGGSQAVGSGLEQAERDHFAARLSLSSSFADEGTVMS